MTPNNEIAAALNPAESVVVEACAGSGKTWLLASRLLRLLLDGVPPSKILAITYTRKAAAEIEYRLNAWLKELAASDDSQVKTLLEERGLKSNEAGNLICQARGLLEKVLLADQPPTITTFHGWFVRLIQAAPISNAVSGYSLADSNEELVDRAWENLSKQCGKNDGGEIALAMQHLFKEHGLSNTKKVINAFLNRRGEWRTFAEGETESALAKLKAELGIQNEAATASEFLHQHGMLETLSEFGRLLLKNGTTTDASAGELLLDAIARSNNKDILAAAVTALLKADETPKQRKRSKALEDRLGPANANRYVDLHENLSTQLEVALRAAKEAECYRFNAMVMRVGESLLREFEKIKAAGKIMDFSDLECFADKLLGSEDAPFVQARLDAKYQHILLDEFQDTNPFQWRILRAWLDAYGQDEQKPRVFMVGDPKQSIYRFRRAEAGIFSVAGDFFEKEFAAKKLYTDNTRRNAHQIVNVLNEVFSREPKFTGFRKQSSLAKLNGGVEVIPLAKKTASYPTGNPDNQTREYLRDPLLHPRDVEEDLRRAEEARTLVSKIQDWVGKIEIEDGGITRTAKYSDIMILCRKRTNLAEYERALSEANIPYLSASRGGLLGTMEASDMAALLGFLVAPAGNLKLVHALRTPVFSVDDEDLKYLALIDGDCWWEKLQSAATQGNCSPVLARAHEKLSVWMTKAAHLPVHDLLADIYYEADVLARYKASVPDTLWPGVRANLEEFIRLSLEMDSGRYPSLPRFVEEIKRLQSAEEAPNEGMVSSPETAGRVQILTIHAAKGLEAPIVWLIDAESASTKGDGYDVLLNWPPTANKPAHFSVFGNKSLKGFKRDALFAEEDAADEREELNLLYVAMTRAKQFFVVSGVESLKQKSKPTFYQRVQEAVERLSESGGLFYGATPRRAGKEGDFRSVAKYEIEPKLPKMEVGMTKEEETEEQRYGTLLHAAIESLSSNLPMPEKTPQTVIDHAKRLVSAPHLSQFFDPLLFDSAANEIEYVTTDGTSGRIDRIVKKDNLVWVLDYKSESATNEPPEEYKNQMRRYKSVVSHIYPKKEIRCALIYGDGAVKEMREL